MNDRKAVYSGNQAIARGFYEAGGLVATSYPGSPTVGILQSVKDNYKEVYSEFSVNEKVALEVGIGASFAGARTMVSMKHVGVNIAADPLMTFTQTRINGGFVLITGDDPGMASSQNEQDNRYYGRFAHMAILDPSDSQEAKDFTKRAFDLSEEYDLPMMLRITSRLCHSRSVVELEERAEKEVSGFTKELEHYAMIPPNTYPKQYHMKERIEKLKDAANSMDINILEASATGRNDALIVTSGITYKNLKELELDISILKLGMVYPLPIEQIQALSKDYDRIIVLEEMMPFIEDELKLHSIPCEGKGYFSHTGELNTEDIEKGLHSAGLIKELRYAEPASIETVSRPPMFCAGCPHRPVFDILKKARASVIGDIGCYSLAVLEPLNVVNSIISMGASVSVMKGMSKALKLGGKEEPLVCVIGDGTFFHSGMTAMLNMLHQMDGQNITILILNNGTTAMTGGQDSATTGSYRDGADMDVQIPGLLEAMGFDRVVTLDQFDYKNAKEVITGELKHEGLSIVMTTRPCALNFKIKETPFYVDESICISCRSCVKTNCPPILMKEYEGYDKLKSSINSEFCVGCSVCAQVCPVGAIKRVSKEGE